MLDKGQSLFSVLGTESRASCILGKYFITQLYTRLKANLLKKKKKDIFIKSLDDRNLERLHAEAEAKRTSGG